MYDRVIGGGGISLGRALKRMDTRIDVNVLSDSHKGLGRVAFMMVEAYTSEGTLNAVGVMTASYCASYLISGFGRIVRRKHGGKMGEDARRAVRLFNIMLEPSVLRSANRAHIPQRIREHAGIPPYGSVFVVERNGYAVISPNPIIAELEAAPWDACATTIDKVVAAIVMEKKLEREAAAIY